MTDKNAEEEVYDQGEAYVPLGVNGILAATEKLLAVNRGVVDTDQREHLAFKRIYPFSAQIAERVRLDTTNARRKLMRVSASRGNLSYASPLFLEDEFSGAFVSNPLASPLEEINPTALVEQARRITAMGPGGIGSSESITEEMQAVNPSQIGFISPTEGPESEKAGIDVRAAMGTKLGSDGRLYRKFLNPRTGNYHWLSPKDLFGKTLRLPD